MYNVCVRENDTNEKGVYENMKKLIAMLLALTMVMAFVGCAKTEAPETTAAPETTVAPTEAAPAETTAAVTEAPAADVMSHEEYMAAPMDSEVTVETYVQGHQSWWDGKVTVYCQSPDGAYFLYELQCSEEDAAKLEKGTKIRVNGFKGEWSGEVEIMDGTFEFVEGGDTFVAEAADVTELLGTDALVDHQNEAVCFKGLTVVARLDTNGDPMKDANGKELSFSYNYDGSGEQGNDLYFNVSVGDQVFEFCVESYLCGADTEVYKAVEALKIGDTIDAEGFLYWYNGVNPHITSVTVVE